MPPPAALPRPALRWMAAFCALTVWLLGLLAGSPELHASLHRDAGLADHTCAVTLYNQGVENPAPSAVLLTIPQIVTVATVAPIEPQRTESPKDWLPPGRGPPGR
ncbi:MAG: hypothetical protein HYV95_09540 [Opitutae bacterium]|nr:hypothetical protein [Opitutae bacterium]